MAYAAPLAPLYYEKHALASSKRRRPPVGNIHAKKGSLPGLSRK